MSVPLLAPRFDFERPIEAPFELTPVDRASTVDDSMSSSVFIHTVHDGDTIPRRFLEDDRGRPLVDRAVLEQTHARERDWGANLVARSLAAELSLPHYGRVRIARALLDVNRFPGSTPPGCHEPLERLAINPPFCDALSHGRKMELLDLYDAVSDSFERVLHDKLLIIGVHTYDAHNASATKRPQLSLINIPAGYQREARMPYGVFDPIFPDMLGESTCSRILRDRVSLNLERAGFRVISNHPYALPEGSIEVRSQVWFFFSYVRQRFCAEHPQTASEPAYDLVWRMLLNTNLREALPEALRGHLHRFRRAAPQHAALFRNAQEAYARIRDYLADGRIRDDFRRSPKRPSSIAIEIRKDLVCDIGPSREITKAATDKTKQRAQLIAQVVAGAIRTYFDTDRPLRDSAQNAGLRPEPAL